MTALIAQSARLQEMFATGEPGLDFKAAAVTFGMMDIDDKHIGYWGLRSMCLEKGYKKQPYYQNLIFANIPEMATLAPVFLATSADDVLSPSMKNFERTLKRWGVESEMQYYERRKDRKLVHMFNVFYPEYEESVEMMDRMTEFFLRRIK
jgi:acetyl esterase/lipase